MSKHLAPVESNSQFTESILFGRRIIAAAAGVMLGILLSAPVYAGGANVSADPIVENTDTDDVALQDIDGGIIDINLDSNPDLVIATNQGGAAARSRFYPGNGDGTFGAPEFLGLTGDQGPASDVLGADLNNDTFLDLLLARRDLTNLIYTGDGVDDLNNSVPASPDTDRTLAIDIGDLDLDGDLDFVTGNGRLGGIMSNPAQNNLFCLNNLIGLGTFTFTCAPIATDADDTRSIVLADMDGDMDADVIVGNDETTLGSNLVYLNQFIESGNIAVSFAAGMGFGDPNDETSKLLVGDLNGDTLPDIVTLNNIATGMVPAGINGANRYFLNTTNAGVFSLAAAVDVSPDADKSSGGVLADFDGDTDLDIAVANLQDVVGTPDAGARNSLYLNQFVPNGSVGFDAAQDIGANAAGTTADEDQSRELDAFDIDVDMDIDIVVGNDNGQPDRRYLNNGSLGPTALPFRNVAPTGVQAGALATDEDTLITIALADVTVTDPDNVIPVDFTLAVQDGTNYTHVGNDVTPAAGFAGDLTVPVLVNDGTDDSAAINLTVTVNNTVNTAPMFTSTGITTATEGVAYTYAITATDPDTSDTLTITAPTLPAWLTLTPTGNGTATLTGTPTATEVGDDPVSLNVSDGTVSGPTQDFTITVTAAGAGNVAPTFTSIAITDATVGTAYSYAITTEDTDGDPLTITAPTTPAWLTFTDNGDGTATLAGTPAAADEGDHPVSLQVSDGTDTGMQDFTITVAAASGDTTPPVITRIGPAVVNITVNSVYNDMGATATDDVDGDLTDQIVTTSDVDTSAIGTYMVSYDVSDAAGNDAVTVTRTVMVSAPRSDDGGGGSLGILSLLAMLGFIGTRRRARVRP